MLIHADRLSEAEALLRSSEVRGSGTATRAFVHLGQGRHREALAAARQAAGALPNKSPYRVLLSLAELFAGEATAQTRMRLDLELDERADEPEDLIDPGWRAEALATRSWAHGVLGTLRAAEADAQAATQAIPPENPPSAGQVHLVLSYAAEARQDDATARTEATKAAQADPGGMWGRLARERRATLGRPEKVH